MKKRGATAPQWCRSNGGNEADAAVGQDGAFGVLRRPDLPVVYLTGADIQTSEIACSITWFSAGASGDVSAMRSRRIPACGGPSKSLRFAVEPGPREVKRLHSS